MRILRQIYLLLQKDLLLIWRSKVWFFLEMIAGLLLLPLILIVITKSGSDTIDRSYVFEPVQVVGGSADIQQQVKSIKRIFTLWCGIDQTLAYSGPNSNALMQMVQRRYSGSPKLIVEPFDTVETMRTTLLNDLNHTSGIMCGNYLGGIIFDKVDLASQELKYHILFPRRMEHKWQLNSFWTENGPYSTASDYNTIPGDPPYWSSGFLSVQFAIENAFLDMLNKTIDFPVYLQRIPSPQFKNTGTLVFLKQVPLIWTLMMLMTILHTVKNIVSEKEAGIKTYMMVMGLDSVAFYSSHFLIGLFKMAIVVIICSVAFSFGLQYVSSTLFVEFTLLYAMAAIMSGVLISTMIRRPSIALTVALMGWIGLMILDSFYTASLTRIPHCFLVSLNPYTAFKLGIKSAMVAETTASYLGWMSIFTNSTHSFTFGFAGLMLIVDIVLMILISLYLDAVWPTDSSPRRSPFFIFGYNPHTAASFEVNRDEADAPDENIEVDGHASYDEADIDVRRMSKVWEGTGQMAVDNLSFRAYRGQVTVLLGHNGAGKSTTFSVISGSTTVTAGNVYICKEDIQSKLNDCQKQIGFCPQYNPLFPRLTVREHLRLYARLKTMEKLATLNTEIEMIAQQVQLKPKLDELAESLSGGMKRKLCVAMALIGDSRVILLDEPTAGMDPEARHDVRILLEKSKRNRAILLTTHYMDEADLLGDRIGIMVKGRMVCNGSPEFLKNRFGTGYVLSVVVAYDEKLCKTFDSITAEILKVTHKHAPEARLDGVSIPEFSIILPVHQKAYFSDLFEELETRKEELHISSFGLSFNTLEQVFLRVGELTDPNEDQDVPDNVCQNTASLFANEAEYTGSKLIQNQMVSLLYRHCLNIWRNKSRTITPVVVSLFLFALFVGLGRINNQSEQLDLSLTNLEPLSVPLIMSHAAKANVGFPFIVGQMSGMRLVSLSPLSKLNNVLLERAAYQNPPFGIGAALMGNDTVLALFNGAAHHTPPAALLLVTNSRINKKPDSIQLGIEVYDAPANANTVATGSPDQNLIVAIIVILAFSSLTSTFACPLVEDNQSRFKNQLLLTKLHVLVYWISFILWHLVLYIFFCLLLTLVFVIFGWMQGCLMMNFMLWSLYFWCCVPFIYCASFIFNSPVKAYAALLCWNVVVSLIALLTDVTLEAVESPLRNAFHYIAFVLLPSFTLGNGMVQIAMHAGVEGLPRSILFNALEQVIWCMIISGLLFWTLLFLLDSKRVSLLVHNIQCRVRKSPYQIVDAEVEEEDEDVVREREALRNFGDENYALAVRDVFKYYGKFCAVRNLTFGVKQTDCFGLLGINGAGKTTTFNILTGEMYASGGRSAIGGVDVNDSPVLGYCPQFDALASDLTGRELLTLLGQLNGFYCVNERVKKVLESIRLMGQANKLVKFYSGGQKRRLSIGVTLMSKTALIMLDEPTAGIDPSTRRKIWQLLIAVRQHNVAILLTSHSMDECEALCNRIGFISKGTLISIGSSQHLKSKYSTSYMLTFTLANPCAGSVRFLDNIVTREFEAKSTTDPPSLPTQHWEIPRKRAWSAMFRRAQQIADKYPHTAHLPLGSERPLIKDFSLTQNSLEQVFLRLAEVSHQQE